MDTVCLYIIDTGIGMPPDVTAASFTLSSRARVARAWVADDCARSLRPTTAPLRCETRVGRGTRFAIRLPVHHTVAELDGRCPE